MKKKIWLEIPILKKNYWIHWLKKSYLDALLLNFLRSQYLPACSSLIESIIIISSNSSSSSSSSSRSRCWNGFPWHSLPIRRYRLSVHAGRQNFDLCLFQFCCRYVRASWPALASPYIRIHMWISLMSPSLLLQRCFPGLLPLGRWGRHSVMVKATDSGIIESEFDLQSRYYVHFQTNTVGKGINSLILPTMG